MFSSSRPTASKLIHLLTVVTGVCVALALLAGTAVADPGSGSEGQAAQRSQGSGGEAGSVAETVNAAPAKVNAELAVCPGQSFYQPFLEYGDSNYYTLVEGSEFNGPEEGWQLRGGASIVEATRPDGSTGGVLDMPSGAVAVSPPVCVTLQYPTARGWVESVEGSGAIAVAAVYTGGKMPSLSVAQLSSKQGTGWELSKPFNLKPQLGGLEEGTREVRFVYVAGGRSSDFHLSTLWVDPRLGH